MAESENIESPRKRVKLSSQVDGSEDSRPTKTPTDVPTQKELDVGITSYVSSHTPAFSGILKKRYTDFLVNEILPNGEVLHLRSTKPPRQNAASSDDKPVPPVQNGGGQSTAEAQNDHSGNSLGHGTDAGSSKVTVFEVNAANAASLEVRR